MANHRKCESESELTGNRVLANLAAVSRQRHDSRRAVDDSDDDDSSVSDTSLNIAPVGDVGGRTVLSPSSANPVRNIFEDGIGDPDAD